MYYQVTDTLLCHKPSQPLYHTLGTPHPNIANPRNTLPWCSQPWDGPFILVFHDHDTLSPPPTFYYLVTLLFLVSLSFFISIVLIILPQLPCTSPRYLGSSSCTCYFILDITNALLTCFLISHPSFLSSGWALLSVVGLCGWASCSQLQLSLAPILLLT